MPSCYYPQMKFGAREYFHKHLSVHRVAGGLCLGVSVQGGLCPMGGSDQGGGLWPGGRSLTRGSLSGGSLSKGGIYPGCSLSRRPPLRWKSGQYVSYWNAFLSFYFFQSVIRWRCGWLFPWILIQTKLYFTRAGHVTTVKIYRFVMSFTNCQRTWLTGIFVSFSLCFYYRPQTKFAKVMFLHLSVILFTGWGACMAGGVRGSPCVARGRGCMHGRGACVAGGACMAGVQGACVVGGVHGRGACMGLHHMRGRYASYWNAFLFMCKFTFYTR